MKKLLIVFTLMLAMMSCGGNSTKTVEVANDTTTIDTIEVVDSTLADTIAIDSIN